DRVSETTKFNETYLLKGDGAEKAHNVNAHDAGLDGVTLTDKGNEVEVTLKELKAGDKISIAGKNYTIGSTADEITNKMTAGAAGAKNSYTINGATYQVDENNKVYTADGKTKVTKAELTGTGAGDAELTDLQGLVKEGSTVTIGTKTYTAMTDKAGAGADGIDDNDSTVITAGKAYQLQTAEIVKASSIGADTAATVKNGANATKDATATFTLNKGTVSYKDALSFNLHVGADADMTNKITVNIDSMNSAGLGVKGIKADTEQDATYAIDAIADAISTVSSQRSSLGAVQNRLEHTINNLDNVVENTTSAESRIRDTDMAEEMVNYSKNNILAQAGQSMLAQANQSNQGVLSLLQ
ncbi:MAG: flagellin, partial [Agathobacter rectalis]